MLFYLSTIKKEENEILIFNNIDIILLQLF